MVHLFGSCYLLKATGTIPEATSMKSNIILGDKLNQYLLIAQCLTLVYNGIFVVNYVYMHFNVLRESLIAWFVYIMDGIG